MVIKRALQKALSQQAETDGRAVDFIEIECNLTKQTISIQGKPYSGWQISLFPAQSIANGEVRRYQCCSVIWRPGETRITFTNCRSVGVVNHRYTSPQSESLTPDSLLEASVGPMAWYPIGSYHLL